MGIVQIVAPLNNISRTINGKYSVNRSASGIGDVTYFDSGKRRWDSSKRFLRVEASRCPRRIVPAFQLFIELFENENDLVFINKKVPVVRRTIDEIFIAAFLFEPVDHVAIDNVRDYTGVVGVCHSAVGFRIIAESVFRRLSEVQ